MDSKETYTYTDTLLIGFDRANNGDNAVLIVGKKGKGDSVEIINAFQGEEAIALYAKLFERKYGPGGKK